VNPQYFAYSLTGKVSAPPRITIEKPENFGHAFGLVATGSNLEISGGTIAMKPFSQKRAVLLAVACLVLILGSVELMNLQVSPRTSIAAVRKAVSPGLSPAGYSAEHHAPPPDLQPPPRPAARRDPGSVGEQPATGAGSADLDYLTSQGLQIPVAGVNSNQLRDSFYDARSEGRRHEAIDIPAPLATPVVSAADGTVARLFNSRLGGTTLYCFDKSGRFVFYYAHLSGYADGLSEHNAIRKGQVLGYVGDTGDAGPGNFHLHFAISKASTPWKWYGGDAIDPYPLLGGKAAGVSSK
jgi:murein DD-endopeptidase MepM/ murein hydrolase activator NlpD